MGSKYRILVLLLLLIAAMPYAARAFYLKGKITGGTEISPMEAYLYRLTTLTDLTGSTEGTVADSAVVTADGHFSFTRKKLIDEHTFYRLGIMSRKNGERHTVASTCLLLGRSSAIVLKVKLKPASYTIKPLKIDSRNQSLWYVSNLPAAVRNSQHMRRIIDSIPDALVSIFAFVNNFPADSAFCAQMNDRYQSSKPLSPYASELFDRIYDVLYTLPLGSIAPEIKLPDNNSREVALSLLRGKYVLLDFWASWCQPCRMENQEIIKPLLKKYGAGNFAVVSISVDTGRQQWLNVLKKDSLYWTQLCDYKGLASPSAGSYKVTDIPVNYIIDPAGRIIGKNIHDKFLREFIEEKMGSR